MSRLEVMKRAYHFALESKMDAACIIYTPDRNNVWVEVCNAFTKVVRAYISELRRSPH